MAIVYAFWNPMLTEPKACLWKAANGHLLPHIGWRGRAVSEVQSIFKGNKVTTTWVDIGQYQVSLLILALPTHWMSYNNLPAHLLGYMLVCILNFPIPIVKFHVDSIELRPKIILNSSWFLHKHCLFSQPLQKCSQNSAQSRQKLAWVSLENVLERQMGQYPFESRNPK